MGLELNLGNYTDPSANYAWFGVYAIYMIIGAVALFICYKCTKERVVATAEQTANVKNLPTFSTSSDITVRWLFSACSLCWPLPSCSS